MTNGDKIRQMSDEELADCIDRIAKTRCPNLKIRCSETCKECWLKWLESEVEE